MNNETNTEPTAIEKLEEIKANGYQDDDAPDGHGIVPDFVWGFMNKALSEAERAAHIAGEIHNQMRHEGQYLVTFEDWKSRHGAKI